MKEKLQKLFDKIIIEKQITKKTLLDCGITKEEIKQLLNDGTLLKFDKTYYKLNNHKPLYDYANTLIKNKEYIKASECYEFIKTMFTNSRSELYQIFLNNIKNKDYDSALKIYKKMSKINNYYQKQEINLYLYLLNIITTLDEELTHKAKEMKYEDICINKNDNRYDKIMPYNQIRTAIITNELVYAKILMSKQAKNENKLISEQITKELINEAIITQRSEKNKVRSFIETKKYEKAIEILEEISRKTQITLGQKYTLILLKELVLIKTTRVIPITTYAKKENIFNFIDNKNYEKALLLSYEHCQKFDEETDVYVLLKEIVKEINQLKSENNKHFVKDYNKYYGIWNFEELDKYIKQTNKSIEKACQDFGYLEDYLSKVYLIYAQINLENNNTQEAKKYLELYKNSLNQTNETKQIYENIIEENQIKRELKK